MSLGVIINKFNEQKIDITQSVDKIKKNIYLSNFSKYIRGGKSDLNKNKLQNFFYAIRNYKKGIYTINNKEIKPDEEQKLIIESDINSNIRVIAGAGTGKTTTIACRIKYLLDNFTTPDKILVLTFNVDAKDNLINTITSMYGFNIKINIRTIDSYCKYLDVNYGYMLVNENKTKYKSVKELGIIGRKIMKKYGKELCGQYRYIFFDEYQDADEEQHHILEEFVKNGCYLTVIGDDSQNIYQFRGTDNYWIINFDKLIPNTMTYKITTNYRSTANIVNMANSCIKNNKMRIDKNMVSYNNDNQYIELHVCESNKVANNKYEYILEKINEYVNDNYEYKDIAIISRITTPLKIIEAELEKSKIPYCSRIDDEFSREYKKKMRESDKITVTTIHGAKGLEWSIVFIIGLCDHHFPTHINNGLKNIEEDRRLFYVAITRAKKYLHFYATGGEIPLSRFINEVKEHIIIKNKTNVKNLFDFEDENSKIKIYGVTRILEYLTGKWINKMKKLGIIPKMEQKTIEIFDTQLNFTEEIKKSSFESDYGIYCDLYMTRRLIIKNKQKLRDMNTEIILNMEHFTHDEINLIEKYDIVGYMRNKQFKTKVKEKDREKVNQIINILSEKMEKFPDNINQFLYLQKLISTYVYPKKFIDNLRKSYDNYVDKNKNTKKILDSIYYISLCSKINNDRKRLIYRNIKDMYEENNKTVIDRINKYIKLIKINKQKCKVVVSKKYKINNEEYCMWGEIDYIDITNKTLVDIKCSENEFKMEWLIQILIYYAMYNESENGNLENKIEIEKLAIINIFSGKYYEFSIPDEYDYNKLFEYFEKIIKFIVNGNREKDYEKSINVDTMLIRKNMPIINKHQEIKVIKIDKCKKRKKYVVLDVENNTSNQDIIQIAYIIYDENDKMIKKVNHYVKDRIIDERASDITGITNTYIMKHGKEFYDIMEEFFMDIVDVKYICGHYIHTDMKKIIDNMDTYDIKPSYNIFKKINTISTEKLYRRIHKCNVGKLDTMCKMLFGENIINAHNAVVDAEYTAKCYVYLRDQLKKTHNIGMDEISETITYYVHNVDNCVVRRK